MNSVLRLSAVVILAAGFLAGCSKKEEAEVVEAGEQALPAEESVEQPLVAETAPGTEAVPQIAVPEPPAPAPEAPASTTPPMNEFAAEAKAFEDWCKKYALDPNDPAMLDSDTDGDGIPNRDEFVGGSNPLDPKARPGIHAEMRLKTYNEVKLPVMLDSVEGDKAFLKQIEGGDAKPQTVKTGDSVQGLKVGRVQKRRDFDKSGNPIDISQVMLEDPATKERVMLVKGLPARTAATYAVITSADGKTSMQVKQGETFEWPSKPGTLYVVIDMSSDQVVVQQVENRRVWTISRE
jgi:hypothetical protein